MISEERLCQLVSDIIATNYNVCLCIRYIPVSDESYIGIVYTEESNENIGVFAVIIKRWWLEGKVFLIDDVITINPVIHFEGSSGYEMRCGNMLIRIEK